MRRQLNPSQPKKFLIRRNVPVTRGISLPPNSHVQKKNQLQVQQIQQKNQQLDQFNQKGTSFEKSKTPQKNPIVQNWQQQPNYHQIQIKHVIQVDSQKKTENLQLSQQSPSPKLKNYKQQQDQKQVTENGNSLHKKQKEKNSPKQNGSPEAIIQASSLNQFDAQSNLQRNQEQNKKEDDANQKTQQSKNQQPEQTFINLCIKEKNNTQDNESKICVLQEKNIQSASTQEIKTPLKLTEKKQILETPPPSKVYGTIKKYPIALLLGMYGVGKKWLMGKLFPNQKLEVFVPNTHLVLGVQFAYSQHFDFDSDIQIREQQIQSYQQFFTLHKGQISQFLILVDFEQDTSKMKQKIMPIYKYFRSFKEIITIIITKFIDTPEKIKPIQSAFQYFQTNIIYLSENESQVNLKMKEVFKNINKFDLHLKDTIFEQPGDDDQCVQKHIAEDQNLIKKEVSKNSSDKVLIKQQHQSTQQQQQSSVIQQQKNVPQESIALLLGTLGVGKKSLMRKIVPSNLNIQVLTPLYDQRLDYKIALAPDFDFESDIESRERQINQYQKFFLQNMNNVRKLFVVVNFERTDLMKNKVISIFKYFRKFKDLISIIITQFQLSENDNTDRESLKKAFKFFTPKDNIIFLKQSQDKEEICMQIEPHLIKQDDNDFEFDCKDTIFEMDDPQEAKEMQEKLNQIAKQIEAANKRI